MKHLVKNLLLQKFYQSLYFCFANSRGWSTHFRSQWRTRSLFYKFFKPDLRISGRLASQKRGQLICQNGHVDLVVARTKDDACGRREEIKRSRFRHGKITQRRFQVALFTDASCYVELAASRGEIARFIHTVTCNLATMHAWVSTETFSPAERRVTHIIMTKMGRGVSFLAAGCHVTLPLLFSSGHRGRSWSLFLLLWDYFPTRFVASRWSTMYGKRDSVLMRQTDTVARLSRSILSNTLWKISWNFRQWLAATWLLLIKLEINFMETAKCLIETTTMYHTFQLTRTSFFTDD